MTAARKPRPRRIAADEAHSWARNLRLKNPFGKLVLSMLTIYVNGEGSCFVSANALAEDCELALETVRRRLAWLESIGAIARFPQWIDEHGRRNSAGKGRRTTDDIRLMIDADPDAIEAKAGGDDNPADPLPEGGANAEADPLREEGDNHHDETASPLPTPSLQRGPESFEPEPEKIPPNPPSGGDATPIEVEGWKDFKTAFEADGDPIVRISIAQQLFAALKPDERAQCTKAAKGLIAWRMRQKKPPSKPSAQTFIREIGAWATWEQHAPPDPVACEPSVFIAEDSDDWRALRVLAVIRDESEPRPLALDPGRGLMLKALRPAVKALAQFAGEPIDTSAWKIFAEGTQQCGAWCEFARMRPHNVDTGETRVMQIGSKIYNDWQVKISGVRVPCEWPPRKGGTLSTAGPKHETNLTEDDMKQEL